MRTFKWIGHQIAVAIMGFKEGYATGTLDAEGQQFKRAMEQHSNDPTPHPSDA
tara:strand:+ start:60 stop:218 length:159 start_codon:yes stop_codon:yes gene_type:complete